MSNYCSWGWRGGNGRCVNKLRSLLPSMVSSEYFGFPTINAEISGRGLPRLPSCSRLGNALPAQVIHFGVGVPRYAKNSNFFLTSLQLTKRVHYFLSDEFCLEHIRGKVSTTLRRSETEHQ